MNGVHLQNVLEPVGKGKNCAKGLACWLSDVMECHLWKLNHVLYTTAAVS